MVGLAGMGGRAHVSGWTGGLGEASVEEELAVPFHAEDGRVDKGEGLAA